MSKSYEHQIIKDTSTGKFYFIAEDVNYDDDEEPREPGDLNLMEIRAVGGPYETSDSAFETMKVSCGNPGWGAETKEIDEGDPYLNAIKALLLEASRVTRTRYLKYGQFSGAWREALDEMRAKKNDEPGF